MTHLLDVKGLWGGGGGASEFYDSENLSLRSLRSGAFGKASDYQHLHVLNACIIYMHKLHASGLVSTHSSSIGQARDLVLGLRPG